jgi:hypothetical protein
MAEERLKIIVDAETKEALTGFKDLIKGLDNVDSAALSFNSSLKDMQNELTNLKKKLATATDVSEIKSLKKQIDDTTLSIKRQSDATAILVNSNAKLSTSTANALPALTNFGRVIQDAPFGILGVANNIDPLVTSFQSLQKQTGSTTKALGAMLGSLAGPAGIGIGISIVTSLMISFGDEIFNFIKGTDGAIENTDEFKKSLEGFRESAAKEIIKFKELTAAASDATLPIKQRKEAVDELQKTYPAYIGNLTQEDILAGKIGVAYDALIKSLQAKIALQATEEKLIPLLKEQLDIGIKLAQAEKAIETAKKDKLSTTDAEIRQQQAFARSTGNGNVTLSGQTQAAGKAAQKLKDELTPAYTELSKKINFAFNQMQPFINATANLNDKFTSGKTKTDELKKSTESLISTYKKLPAATISPVEPKAPKPIISQEPVTLGGALDAKTQQLLKQLDVQKQIELQQLKNDEAAQKGIEKQAAAYSGLLFPAVDSVFSALNNGTSVIDSLGDSLKKLALDLAAAAVKAAILAAIMNVIAPGSSAAVGGGGGFGSLFKGLLGFANGGIVSKPTIGVVGERNESEAIMPLSRLSGMLNMAANIGASNMGGSGEFVIRGNDLVLATNRANSSLNLRR